MVRSMRSMLGICLCSFGSVITTQTGLLHRNNPHGPFVCTFGMWLKAKRSKLLKSVGSILNDKVHNLLTSQISSSVFRDTFSGTFTPKRL